ncbi:MAG TPA: efflux RND transporter periplasmic adaptor subunit [Candidatus Acidoferrales bacterium]|nr:efflux RND transporter periplasmic adaptor subunit [Candidatus Acidoferrales bacterium]
MLRRNKSFQIVCALSVLLTACAKKDPPAFERPPSPVTVATSVSQDVPLYLDEVGRTIAREVVSVQPEVSGRITEIHFTDGADLKKGDPLFTIDPRPFEAQVSAAEANLAQSKAALDFARIQFARVQDLVESRAIARQDYDTRKNAVDVGEAQVRQNEAALESARLNLEYTAIHSPIDGRAGHRLVDIGNVVTANTTTLLTIERMDPIYADFTVTENDFPDVKRNADKRSLKVEVRLPDEPDKPSVGQLTFLDNSVQSTSGTVMLRATVPNSSHYLWPGQFVNVRLVLATLQKAVLVPASATQDSAKGTFVYVVKQDSTAELRAVKLGQRQGEMVVIEQGLQPNEQVVINGQLGVMPGGKVRIVTSGNTAPAAGQS